MCDLEFTTVLYNVEKIFKTTSFRADYLSFRSVTKCAVCLSIRNSLLPNILCAVIRFCAEKKRKLGEFGLIRWILFCNSNLKEEPLT